MILYPGVGPSEEGAGGEGGLPKPGGVIRSVLSIVSVWST